MVDNSWITTDTAKSNSSSNMMRMKVLTTVVIILAGAFITVLVHDLGTTSSRNQSEGVLIDFALYDTNWTNADYESYGTPLLLLDYACASHGFTHTIDTEGRVTEINGVNNSSEKTWELWYIEKGQNEYRKSDSYDIDPKNYSITTWAYRSTGETPNIAMDASGTSIYGYAQAERVVTLSPVCTEIMGALNAASTIVGTDMYSNYPHSIRQAQEEGKVAIVGTYTDPSYESIMHTSPNMVICDGSQYNHIQMAKTMRNSDVNAVLIYDGEDIKTIYDNIFIVGSAIGYNMRATSVCTDLHTATETLKALIGSGSGIKAMFSLSTDSAPWVAGDNTYAADILETMGAINIYSSMSGWTHINSEYLGTGDGSSYNPERIVVLVDSSYHPTQEDYDFIMNHLPDNWKSTTAYSNGDIYMFFDNLAEMSQRSGPRFAQLTEIVGRIMNPDAFTDGITVPKYIGNNYSDYLTYTGGLGFDS